LLTWTEIVEFLQTQVQELAATQLDQIRFADADVALGLSIVVGLAALATLSRLAFSRRKHHRHHSGHDIDPRFQRGPVVRALYNLPKLILALALLAVAVAIADPFLMATDEVSREMESRVRIDLVDTSLSMAWEFPNTGRSRAEIAREAHLEFLDMRREKGDRVSLWLFSSYPYMVDDFVFDDEMYYFQVMEAPYVTVKMLAPQSGTPRDAIFVPPDKVRIIETEGTTNLVRALQAIVRHFDQDEASAAGGPDQNRALLIVTDAEVDDVPHAELAALNKRNIVPYLIYINTLDTRTSTTTTQTVSNVEPLIETIRGFGGDYFDVTDQDGLNRAYEAIDEREAVWVEVTHRAIRVPIYARFLLVSLALLAVGIPAGFLVEFLWGTHP
jgi:hypothetical protein